MQYINDEKYSQMPKFAYRDILSENPNMLKSATKQDIKIKKSKANRIKMAAIGTSIVIGVSSLISSVGSVLSKYKERSEKLSDAHIYTDTVIIPQIMQYNENAKVDEDGKYLLSSASKEEFYELTHELSDLLGISQNTASYAIFEYCDYDEALFKNLGYADAETWARKHDYAPHDELDSTCLTVFQNMNEVSFVEAVDEFKEASLELNSDNIYEVKTYMDFNLNNQHEVR